MKLKIILIMMVIVSLFGTVLAEEPEAVHKGIINADQVNLRTAPNVSGTVITVLSKSVEVTILEQDPAWYKVRLADSREGWVAKNYMAVYNGSATNRGKFFVDLISYAKNFLRTHYRYGGSSPTGFDCSGFTRYIFSKFGLILPHNAAAQERIGAPITKEELLPGDLVFFATGQNRMYTNHVGIYIGDNQFIHASSAQGAVIITSLNSNYYLARFRSAKRIASNTNIPY